MVLTRRTAVKTTTTSSVGFGPEQTVRPPSYQGARIVEGPRGGKNFGNVILELKLLYINQEILS